MDPTSFMKHHAQVLTPFFQSLRVSVAVIKYTTKSNFVRKGFVPLTLPCLSLSLREVRAGAQEGNLEA